MHRRLHFLQCNVQWYRRLCTTNKNSYCTFNSNLIPIWFFPYVLHSIIVLHWEKLINFSSCLTRLGSFKEYHSGFTESSTSCMSEPYCKYPVTTRKKIVLHFFFWLSYTFPLVVLHLWNPLRHCKSKTNLSGCLTLSSLRAGPTFA